MIEKSIVKSLVETWLEGKDYFLVDIEISQDNKIVVEIDHADGVWIEDCVELSRHIEEGLDRDEEDFELEVGSAGIGQPFKVLKQYEIHIGDPVESILYDGRKMQGVLKSVSDEEIGLVVQEKVKTPEMKRPKLMEVDHVLKMADIKETHYWLK